MFPRRPRAYIALMLDRHLAILGQQFIATQLSTGMTGARGQRETTIDTHGYRQYQFTSQMEPLVDASRTGRS